LKAKANYTVRRPPVTGKMAPEIKLASAEAKNK